MQHALPLRVVCLVLLDENGAVLATQRPEGKTLARLWEFPGGKIEPGETAETALRRELREELSLAVGALVPMVPVMHTYDFGQIELIPLWARCSERPEVSLNEHAAARWVSPEEWEALDWAPADSPILEEVRRLAMVIRQHR